MKSFFYNLSGKILIASPYVPISDVFSKSVIYVLSHTEEGAVGLMVNHVVNRVPFDSFFRNITNSTLTINTSNQYIFPVYLGGPVEKERGFFLHSSEYEKNILFKFQEEGICISSNTEIVKDIAEGNGPKESLFAIGYTGWEAGQLETEVENNLWIISNCEKDIIFSTVDEQKWINALKRIGIDNSCFSSRFGHS